MRILNRDFLRRYRVSIALVLLIVVGALLYTHGAATNPPGFFIDESSIAYNAQLIAQTGRDEFDKPWPLYFRAFTDYKNPVHIYLLAALFKLTGPSIAAARYLSAIAGVLTGLLLGLLAVSLTRRSSVGLFVILIALLTPWLFELSRVVMEVALYPTVLAIFLLSVRGSSTRISWRWTDVAALSGTLALLTYTYSIGRLLGPLLAIGLSFFVTRARWRWLLLTWGAYALTLVPLFIFQKRNPQALTARFQVISFIGRQSTSAEVASQFVKHYLANINPWRLFITEHSNVSEIVHIPGAQPMLAAAGVLIVAGIYLLVRQRKLDAWWRFVLYGLAASIVPASLTNEHFHMLRLAPVPVFLVVLTIPALNWLFEEPARRRGVILAALLIMTIGEGFSFQIQYRADGRSPRRLHLFDADYPAKILPAALAASPGRIYIADAPAVPGYIQAYWYGTLQDRSLERFVVLAGDQPPPENAIVISTDICGPRCRTLAASEPYTVYLSQGPPRTPAPLPEKGFHAEVKLVDRPTGLRRGAQAVITVELKNVSEVVWLARERAMSPFQLSLGNHWLDLDGKVVVHDDGRGALPRDLRPGESVEISFTINAPVREGNYQLEIDMLQEGVSWFGLRGSPTVRLPVVIR